MLSIEERGRLLSEAVRRGDTPIEINCTGAPPDKIRNLRKTISAEIFNKKIKRWQKVELTEYNDACPICGKLMKVTAVVGSTWVAACSEEHTIQTMKELEKEWFDQKEEKIDIAKESHKSPEC